MWNWLFVDKTVSTSSQYKQSPIRFTWFLTNKVQWGQVESLHIYLSKINSTHAFASFETEVLHYPYLRLSYMQPLGQTTNIRHWSDFISTCLCWQYTVYQGGELAKLVVYSVPDLLWDGLQPLLCNNEDLIAPSKCLFIRKDYYNVPVPGWIEALWEDLCLDLIINCSIWSVK